MPAVKRSRNIAIDCVLSREEWSAMLKVAKDPLDHIILVLGTLGLRANEIAHLRRESVDMVKQHIRLVRAATKNHKGRVVPYGAMRLFSQLIHAFFVMEDAIGISRVSIFRRVRDMGSRAKLAHPITPHGLRATGATWMLAAGYSISGLMHHFGWTDLETAQHYVRITGAAAEADMQRCGERVI